MVDRQVQNMPIAEGEKSAVRWKILLEALEEHVLNKKTTRQTQIFEVEPSDRQTIGWV